MKFAKELERDHVPEWRAKYLNYKQGKKKVKAVRGAVTRANATPRIPDRPNLRPHHSTYGATSPFTPRARPRSTLGQADGPGEDPVDPLRESPAPFGINSQSGESRPESEESSGDHNKKLKKTPPMAIPKHKQSPEPAGPAMLYGSFVPTPPTKARPFELPDPAVSPQTPIGDSHSSPTVSRPTHLSRSASISVPQNTYEEDSTNVPRHRSTFASLRTHLPKSQGGRPYLRRMFSVGTPLSEYDSSRLQMTTFAVDQVKVKQKEFMDWMEQEFDKVESFYKLKEDEAGDRLKVLREQLHEMRNRRIEEVAEAQHAKEVRKEDERAVFDFRAARAYAQSKKDDDASRPNSRDHLNAWLDPIERAIDHAKAKVLGPHPGTNSKALQHMKTSPQLQSKVLSQQNRMGDDGRDYVRRHPNDGVPYRTAKRKLKLALQEFYRGMELLKSYSLLNRLAFRKINKKYDKAIDAHPPLRFMSEKVNKAYFVNSDVLEGHIHSVEDLYARYFEKGNRKVATGKLKSTQGRARDESDSAFRNGILIGTGAVFLIQGIIYGADLLHHPDPTIQVQTSYLLQIYGGYFLALYLFSWFCLDCSIWTRNKINYQFVFEFDPRHTLDWRQLAEFPSFLVLVLGLFVWLNFSRYGAPEMFIYYPVILIFVTVVIIFIPAPIIFHRSRRWFVYSHWRLLLAGLYPVEFRDFFLGDMYCSLTYYMGNIELFFCLYAHYWNNPPQCNSSHSRLLGFFSTLPGIWRALQCLRRYYDTRNVFPHLVNCGKYSMTIMYYVTLSLYRIHKSHSLLALFSTFATINALYCSLWDLFMDWSLLQPHAKTKLLRDVRAFKNPYWYYAAMIIDPILRFNWIFYSIYTQDVQHSSVVSFLVGLSEVTRRGIWTAFRVENEHSSNVARFKAFRDVPLPYDLEASSQESLAAEEGTAETEAQTTGATSPALSRHRSRTGGALEAQETHTGSSMRRRPAAPTRTFTRILAEAHTQDFEKKRKPGAGDSDNVNNMRRDGSPVSDEREHSSDEDEEDDADEQEVLEAENLIRERTRQPNGDGGGRDR